MQCSRTSPCNVQEPTNPKMPCENPSKSPPKSPPKSMSEASLKRALQLFGLSSAPEFIFERLGAPNGHHMEPKGLPKWRQNRCQHRFGGRNGVSGGLGRASGSYKPPFGDHCRPISVPNRLPAALWSPFGTDLGAIWPLF